MISKSNIFEVYEDRAARQLFTANLVPGSTVYGEKLVVQNSIEYRAWDAFSSKIAAAILKGATNIFIRKESRVLYVGSASGTTVSHVSDMVGKDGMVFAVDISARVMNDLLFNLHGRSNVAPVLIDARNDALARYICQCSVLFQDIAQKDQVNAFLQLLAQYVEPGGYGLLAVKARSIDVTKKPGIVFRDVRAALEQETTIVDFRTLDPYQKDHALFIVKKRN